MRVPVDEQAERNCGRGRWCKQLPYTVPDLVEKNPVERG